MRISLKYLLLLCLLSCFGVFAGNKTCEIKYRDNGFFKAEVIENFNFNNKRCSALKLPRNFHLRKDTPILQPFQVTDAMDLDKWQTLKSNPHDNVQEVYHFDHSHVYLAFYEHSSMLYNPAYMEGLGKSLSDRYHQYYDCIDFYLPNKCSHPLGVSELVNQLKAGMEHLHKHHIYHGDLKGNNVLAVIDRKNRPHLKFIDFWSSVKMPPQYVDFGRDIKWLNMLIGGLEKFRPFYVEMISDASSNYCHMLRDTIFPLFVELHRQNRHATFHQNIFYLNEPSLFNELFYAFSDNATHAFSSAPSDVRVIKINKSLGWKSEILKEYMPKFLEAIYSRFDIKHHSTKKIMTLVQRSTSRTIVNINALSDSLQRFCSRIGYDFQVVKLENLSFKEQVQLMANTDIFIAYHGAALTNAPFIKKNGIVLEIQPFGLRYDVFDRFASGGRPDVTYIRWNVNKENCQPILPWENEKSPEEVLSNPYSSDYKKCRAYWRDQHAYVDPYDVISILEEAMAWKNSHEEF